MNHLCPTKSNCLPGNQFLGSDTPFANFSAEKPDIDTFLGSNFGWDLNVPRLGWIFTDTDGAAWCRASTQQLADQCAQNTQLTQQIGTWHTPTGPAPNLFFNAQVQCPFTCPDGLQFVWTVPAGTFQAMDQATANSMAMSFACQQALRFYICLGTLTPNACVGTIYTSTVTFTGGKPPVGVQIVAGSAPPGLLLSQDPQGQTFTLSGTPSAAGNFTFTVMATDALGNFMNKQYTIAVVGITNLTSLPQPTVARPYSAQLLAAGGTSPYTFTAITGLPQGLVMNSSGAISGSVSVHYTGKFSVTFSVTDSANHTCVQTWNSQANEPPGPDWTTLTWQTYQLNQGTAANFVAGQGSGPNAFASLVLSSNLANVSISPVQTLGVAYTGPMVNCEMQVIVSNWDPSAVANFIVTHSVTGQLPVGGGPITGPGTYNLTFTIPASVAATVSFSAGAGQPWAQLPANMYFGTSLKEAFTWQVFNV